jgi:hypothetical protein
MHLLQVLQCEFLSTSGLEDSAEFRDEGDEVVDRFEESISIEEQLHRASSRQALSNPQNLFGSGDDSIEDYINRRLPGKGLPQGARYPAPSGQPAVAGR